MILQKDILKQGKILIIDDEKTNVRFLEIVLREAEYSQVHSTIDPRKALELFHSIQPDLVLLDLSMPHLDGFAVMRQLHAEMPDHSVPILVLTADATAATKHKALKEGAQDFLSKPLDEIEVLLRIHILLESRFHNVLLEDRVLQRTQELEKSRAQLRALTAGLTSTIEADRTQISREVHDVLGQALTGLKMDVAWLQERLPDGEWSTPLREKTRSMSRLIDTTIQEVQRIASQLRPTILDDFGLEAAIEWQLQEFQERTNMHCDFVSSLDDMELSDEQSITAFRIFQEALTNIARHAAASRIDILLEENAGQLVLEVHDNGCGMDDAILTDVKSLGVLGMQERVRLVSGQVTIHGIPGKGTTVTMRIPLQQASN